jgi:hypothetical protein
MIQSMRMMDSQRLLRADNLQACEFHDAQVTDTQFLERVVHTAVCR